LGWRQASLGTPGRGRVLTVGGVGVGQVLHIGMGRSPTTPDGAREGREAARALEPLEHRVSATACRRQLRKGGGTCTGEPLLASDGYGREAV
jgi:hypothetical protein